MSEITVADPRWTLMWCRGEDTVSFLQGLLSADLTAPAGTVKRSFLLEPQGKLTAVLWLLIGEGEVGLIVDADVAEEAAKALNRFRIRVKAEIEITQDPVQLHIGAAMVPGGTWERRSDSIVADISRSGITRTVVIGAPVEPAVTPDEYTALRVRLGEPVMGVDVSAKTIPQETGLVAEAVSFTKGCYLGQELVARIDSRGHVNQRLVRVDSPHPFAVGDVVAASEREAVVTSAAPSGDGWIGMATVRRELVDGAAVTIRTATGDAAGTIHDYQPSTTGS